MPRCVVRKILYTALRIGTADCILLAGVKKEEQKWGTNQRMKLKGQSTLSSRARRSDASVSVSGYPCCCCCCCCLSPLLPTGCLFVVPPPPVLHPTRLLCTYIRVAEPRQPRRSPPVFLRLSPFSFLETLAQARVVRKEETRDRTKAKKKKTEQGIRGFPPFLN